MQIREARDSERAEIFANVHEVWPHDPDLNTHINLRLASEQHKYARFYIAQAGNAIVASLACYPFTYLINGAPKKGIGIGAVHTISSHRKQGIAKKLLEYVHQCEKDQGACLSILYSDISPQYYEKLGYRILPIKHGFVSPKDHKIPLNITYDKPIFAEGRPAEAMVEHHEEHKAWLERRHKFVASVTLGDDDGSFLLGFYEGENFVLNWTLKPEKSSQLKAILEQIAYDLKLDTIKYWLSEQGWESEGAVAPDLEVPMVLSLDGDRYENLSWRLQAIDHI